MRCCVASLVMPALMVLSSSSAGAAQRALKLDNSDFPALVIVEPMPEDDTRYGPDCAHMKVALALGHRANRFRMQGSHWRSIWL